MRLFSKLLGKISSVSSTTRWVCKQYKIQKRKHPKFSDKQLLETIIEKRYDKIRYKLFPDQLGKHTLLENIINTSDIFTLAVGIVIEEKRHSSITANFDSFLKITKKINEIIEELTNKKIRFEGEEK